MKKLVTYFLCVITITACSQFQSAKPESESAKDSSGEYQQGKVFTPREVNPMIKSDAVSVANQSAGQSKNTAGGVYKGTGDFIHKPSAKSAPSATDETVTLNFTSQQDIREVLDFVFTDLLKKRYWVDPKIQGSAQFKAENIPLSAVLPTMEAVLRLQDIVVVNGDGVYKVVPVASVKKGIRVPSSNRSGYRAQAFALHYIAASEMAKIISTTADKSGVIVDDVRNIMIVTGTGPELEQVAESVKIFDVDWLNGMSVAIFAIENTDTKSVSEELNHIIGKDKNPNAALIRILPIERLNSLLVITPQPSYLDQIGAWVKRLDQPGNQAGQRLYVYYVQSGKASDLADILNQVVGDGGGADSNGNQGGQTGAVSTAAVDSKNAAQVTKLVTSGIQLSGKSDIKVIADEVNNALLIKADPAGYRLVRDALAKLDITPLQVLIEVTIAEVTLKDKLQYGVEWFFKNSINGTATESLLDLGTAGIGNAFTGFQLKVKDSAGVKAVIEALDDASDVKILSSPSVMVLNNQTAQIEVGDEVPILTQQSTSSSQDADNPFVVNSVEYKQTGILLNVTPRVNVNGLVTLEVLQEVSDVIVTASSKIDSPTITQRKVETLVAVNSAQTVILAGLISEKDTESESGIPVLMDVPLIGPLFGTTAVEKARSELMIMITPHVIENDKRASQITNENKYT